jgi:ATP-dependent DNA ligase
LVNGHTGERLHLSPVVDYADWDQLARLRANPPVGAAAEGLMLKRWDSPYLAGRPKGPWFKWKRDPHLIDAVLMYAQRGHGKRSSFYSDYTFGVWTEDADGIHVLTPVGKAYFGFTDEELKWLDRYIRNHTVNRFGPVRETRVVTGYLESSERISGIGRRRSILIPRKALAWSLILSVYFRRRTLHRWSKSVVRGSWSTKMSSTWMGNRMVGRST